MRLPVRRGGLGLRSCLDTSPAAFVGSVEMSLPHFGGEGGICQLLEPVLGGLHRREDEGRWAPLLASGCRTGRELSAAWQLLQAEAQEAAAYLGEELTGALAAPVAGLGEGCRTGHTRALVVEQREKLRASVLSKALQEHRDQSARPVFAFHQFDKLSQAWILALPTAATHLSSPVFRSAMATKLCLDSPECADKIGQPVGQEGRVVDRFGDNVMCARLPFDTWRHRHDDCKVAIVERAHHAHVECDAEIFGEFRHLIPAGALQEGGELGNARARNGKVPDLRYRLPLPPALDADHPHRRAQGHPPRLLAELKVISAGPTWYPRGSGEKAVDRRARLLGGEYRRALAKLDRQFHGTAPNQAGPLQRRLEELVGEAGLQGLVVGRWGEGSRDLHNLVQGLAEARALHLARLNGVPTSAGTLAGIIGSYRRILSCTFVRSQESCLLSRMGHLDAGAQEAAARRRLAVRQEQLARDEASAYFAAYVRGRQGPMRGQLPL